MADTGHFGESQPVVEKCPNYILSGDTGCFMNSFETPFGITLERMHRFQRKFQKISIVQ